MTKAELIARVHAKKDLPRDLTKKTVLQVVNHVFTEMGDYFIREKTVRGNGVKLTYPGFGTFSKRRRPGRVVRDIRTGAPIEIPPQFTVTFSLGTELKSLMNRGAGPKAPPKKSAATK
ncbi:MAG TPA: HU family DNA-binding protein [Polyangia bacterium]|jgi:DNA-binding protein HU-beta